MIRLIPMCFLCMSVFSFRLSSLFFSSLFHYLRPHRIVFRFYSFVQTNALMNTILKEIIKIKLIFFSCSRMIQLIKTTSGELKTTASQITFIFIYYLPRVSYIYRSYIDIYVQAYDQFVLLLLPNGFMFWFLFIYLLETNKHTIIKGMRRQS